MQRRLAALVVVAALAGPAQIATAQVVTWDPGNAVYNILQAERLLSQIQQMQRQYEAIAHTTSVQGIANALGGLGRMTQPTPGETMGYTRGQGQWGSAGMHRETDRAYASPQADEWQMEMERRENVTANVKAMAEQNLIDNEETIASLEAMKAELEAQPDGTAVEAHAGAIQLAAMKVNAQQAQLDQARLLLAAEDRVQAQRAEQIRRRDLDLQIERTRGALAGW